MTMFLKVQLALQLETKAREEIAVLLVETRIRAATSLLAAMKVRVAMADRSLLHSQLLTHITIQLQKLRTQFLPNIHLQDTAKVQVLS